MSGNHMKVNIVMIRNILVLFMLVILNACTSVKSKIVSNNGNVRSNIDFSQLGISGKNAVVVSSWDKFMPNHQLNCDKIKGGFSKPKSFAKSVEKKVAGALRAKGYHITSKENLTPNDLLVEVHYRCHSQTMNAWVYGFSIATLPAWNTSYVTTTVSLKNGTGSLLGRYRMVADHTGYMTLYSPVGALMGGDQDDAINDFADSVSSSFR